MWALILEKGNVMTVTVTRRSFIAGALASSWVLNNSVESTGSDDKLPPPTLDIHVHLFGVGDGGTGCRIAKSITERKLFGSLVELLGLRVPGKTIDERYEEALTEQVVSSGLDKVAVLGQDAVYDRNGQPDWERTSFYVPNDYVFDVVARHSETMMACPSINPERADALDELARCHAKGARLLKIHPPTQGVNIADGKHTRFFRRCCDLNIVVLVHTGHEHSAPVIDKSLAAPRRLELALDQGCTVVACHAGTGWVTDTPDQLPEFVSLLKRYPNLWGDTAVLGTAGRVRDFGRLLDGNIDEKIDENTAAEDQKLIRSRLLHGSDFPFPANPAAFIARLGLEASVRLELESNLLKRDFDLKEALGIGRDSAQLAWKVAGVNPIVTCQAFRHRPSGC